MRLKRHVFELAQEMLGEQTLLLLASARPRLRVMDVDEFLDHLPACVYISPSRLPVRVREPPVRFSPRILERGHRIVAELDAAPTVHYYYERLAPRSNANAKSRQALVPIRHPYFGQRQLADADIGEAHAGHGALAGRNWAPIWALKLQKWRGPKWCEVFKQTPKKRGKTEVCGQYGAICGRSSVAEHQLPKLITRVRFPPPAPTCQCPGAVCSPDGAGPRSRPPMGAEAVRIAAVNCGRALLGRHPLRCGRVQRSALLRRLSFKGDLTPGSCRAS